MTPPFTITAAIMSSLATLERLLGRYEGMHHPAPAPQLRRSQRIRTIQASLQIEGNTLTEDQVTAILEGRPVAGPARDVKEVQNAIAAYESLSQWQAHNPKHLLAAHRRMMAGLMPKPGHWRSGGVAIAKGSQIAHLPPPASRVPTLMAELTAWLKQAKDVPPLVAAAVFHYELEFIHPFADGNGRMGRLWHTLILSRYHALLALAPVESIIRDRQSVYYQVLGQCDKAGNSTLFIEFSLEATITAAEAILQPLAKQTVTSEDRLQLALQSFGSGSFSRKDYLALFPTLSTATASRDLAAAVAGGNLVRSGEQAKARYSRST
jgi:Fic family protein